MSDPRHPPLTAARIQKIESALSLLLRAGVIISTLFILVGVFFMFAHHPEYRDGSISAQSLARTLPFPHTVAEVCRGLAAGEGRSIIIAGLFVLIATPIARVAASFLIFLHARDRRFSVITLLVLILLLVSFLLGRAGG